MTTAVNFVENPITGLASAVIAIGVLWRYLARPAWRAWKRVSTELEALHSLAQRELTHNGGSSLKDAVHRTAQTIEKLDGQVTQVKEQSDGTTQAVEALAQMLDAIVDRKQEDHEEMWGEIIALGGEDRRRIKRRSDD